MQDLQILYVRSRVRLTGAENLPMLKILARTPRRVEELATTQSVTIGGTATQFFRTPDGSVVAVIPPGTYLNTTAFMAQDTPGVALDVRVVRDVAGVSVVETIDVLDLAIDANTVILTGEDFSNVAEIRVNETSVQFIVLDKTSLICKLPDNIETIESISAFSTMPLFDGASSFTYMLGASPAGVTGTRKMVQQFVKLLWTTRGSDTFNSALGGNLQKFIGSPTDPTGTDVLIRLITDIQKCASSMTAAQLSSTLPQDEVLAAAEIESFSINPDDPTVIELSLNLRTLSGITAAFSMKVGSLEAAAQSAVENLYGVV